MITNEQWKLIDDKYGKLIAKICNNISGDYATASFDDNLQDLRIATLDAVAGFSKKEGKSFDEFWGTLAFNKYIKTCLWNLKNKKGARISKRYHINKDTVDITAYEEILVGATTDSSSMSSVSMDSLFTDAKNKLDQEQRNVIDIVVNNPDFVKPNGKVNVLRLSNELGCCHAKGRKILSSIRTKLQMDL
tara:strand:- start:191 stop:760 length:570 start_codon:yes stop_codon:yes gene_type:complete